MPSSLILPVLGSSVQDAPRRDALEPGPAADQPPASSTPADPLRVESLQGWHLPLLDDPAFLPLQPLLQRSLLLAVPDRLLTALRRQQPLTSHALVALRGLPGGQQQILGLIVCRRLNRSSSSWQVEHLRLPIRVADPAAPGRLAVAGALLREAIQRARSAASWFATASSLDSPRLALLREQGFQPQRTDLLWSLRLQQPLVPALPAGLQLQRLQRGNAALLWHLEQATCPAQLRQLLDRSIEDLLDQSGQRGWMLVDPTRNEAVAAVRWLNDRPDGGQQVELSVHPLWQHLLGAPCERLLQQAAGSGCQPLWLTSEVGDRARQQWLRDLGAEPQQEQVLMARSVWRRRGVAPARFGVARLEAVLEQFQPRRRPLPTPVGGVSLR